MADAKHTPMVIAAARELCRQHAVACEVNKDDCWNLYAEDFKKDAQRVLDAAGAPELLEALVGLANVFQEGQVFPRNGAAGYAEAALATAEAAIAKATPQP